MNMLIPLWSYGCSFRFLPVWHRIFEFEGLKPLRSCGAVCLIFLLLMAWNAAPAQGEQPTVSQNAHQRLEAARGLLQGGQWNEAERLLQAFAAEFSHEPYAMAVAWQMHGYVLTETGRHQGALASFEKALALNSQDGELQQQLRYNTAQILLLLNRPGEAVQRIESWLQEIDSLTAEQRVQVASIYYGAGRYRQAADHLERAVDGVRNPRDEWLEMLVAALHHSGNYASLARRLPVLLERHPQEKRYWEQLAAVYLQLKRYRQAASVLSTAHHMGLFQDSADIIRLAQLYRQAGVPRMACEILQNALNEGRISLSYENYELLANGWLQAREKRRAAHALQQKIRIRDTCKGRIRLGQLFMELEDWPAASEQLKGATAERCGEARDKALLLLGIASYHAGHMEDARKAFAQAREKSGLRRQAENWLNVLERRNSTEGQLEG